MPVISSRQELCEFFPLKPIKVEKNVLTESANGAKRNVMRLTSLVQKMDWLNENGRYYPSRVMVEAVNHLQPAIKRRSIVGELDHPEDAKIHSENVCFAVSKLWTENTNVFATFDVLLGMPKADMLACLIEHGIEYSISSRGVGDIKEEFINGSACDVVQPGYRFITFDAVQEPSVQGTALRLMESKIKEKASNRIKLEKAFIAEMKLTLKI